MKEQVKEWIADKNLTTDSFDSIMIGVIYNSGHSTLDDPDVRKWIEMHPNEFRLMLPPKLTDDQQVVLEWLKNLYGCHYYQPFVAVSLFRHSFWTEKIEENYNQLDRKQQAQVLEVFSRWAQEQEEE